jgi:hypothetical protein
MKLKLPSIVEDLYTDFLRRKKEWHDWENRENILQKAKKDKENRKSKIRNGLEEEIADYLLSNVPDNLRIPELIRPIHPTPTSEDFNGTTQNNRSTTNIAPSSLPGPQHAFPILRSYTNVYNHTSSNNDINNADRVDSAHSFPSAESTEFHAQGKSQKCPKGGYYTNQLNQGPVESQTDYPSNWFYSLDDYSARQGHSAQGRFARSNKCVSHRQLSQPQTIPEFQHLQQPIGGSSSSKITWSHAPPTYLSQVSKLQHPSHADTGNYPRSTIPKSTAMLL